MRLSTSRSEIPPESGAAHLHGLLCVLAVGYGCVVFVRGAVEGLCGFVLLVYGLVEGMLSLVSGLRGSQVVSVGWR